MNQRQGPTQFFKNQKKLQTIAADPQVFHIMKLSNMNFKLTVFNMFKKRQDWEFWQRSGSNLKSNYMEHSRIEKYNS